VSREYRKLALLTVDLTGDCIKNDGCQTRFGSSVFDPDLNTIRGGEPLVHTLPVR